MYISHFSDEDSDRFDIGNSEWQGERLYDMLIE